MIDPSIPLGIRPLQIQSPLEAIQPVLQLQAAREQTEARRLAADEARQKAADAAAIRKVLTESGGDVEKALPQLRMIAPTAALAFETELHKGRKEAFEGLQKQTEYRTKQLELGSRLLQSVTDEASFQLIRPMIGTLSPEVAQALGETYDPAKVQQWLQVGLSTKDLYDRRQDALTLFTEGKAAEALGTFLSTARTPEEWDGMVQGAVQLGVPSQVVAQFGAYSPENVARAGQIAKAKPAGDAGFTLSPGQQRFGPGGEVVASVPAAPGGTGDFTLTPGATRFGPGGEVIARIPPTPAAAGGGAGGGRGVTSGDAGKIAELDTSRDDLAALSAALTAQGATGTIAAAGAAMPKWVSDLTGWGVDAKKKQALIDRVKQVIGKALEGGVLRKEDEIKYEKILPTIGDEPTIVVAKLQGLDAAIAQRRATHLDALADAGYDVSKFQARAVRPPLGVDSALTVTAPNGTTYTFKTAAEAAAFKARAGIR